MFVPAHCTQLGGIILGTFSHCFPSWVFLCPLRRRSALDLCTCTCVWQSLCPAKFPPQRRSGTSSSCSQNNVVSSQFLSLQRDPSRRAAGSLGCQGVADALSCHFTRVRSHRAEEGPKGRWWGWGRHGLPWPGQRLQKEGDREQSVLDGLCCWAVLSSPWLLFRLPTLMQLFSYLAWSYINSKLCCGSNKRWYKTDPRSWLPLSRRWGRYQTGCVLASSDL